MAKADCKNISLPDLGNCGNRNMNGTTKLSINWTKMECEVNGVLHGKITEFDSESITVERISQNPHINGSIEKINLKSK